MYSQHSLFAGELFTSFFLGYPQILPFLMAKEIYGQWFLVIRGFGYMGNITLANNEDSLYILKCVHLRDLNLTFVHKRSKMIIFKSFLTTIEVSSNFSSILASSKKVKSKHLIKLGLSKVHIIR